jgi:hypothetical protein
MRHEAIISLYKNVVIVDDTAGAFDAEGNSVLINEQEVQAETIRLQAEYNAKKYQRDRAKAYPSIPDQLDTLYHGGYDAWKASIDVVKNKYPKGVA